MWSLFYFFLYIVLVLSGSTRIHCIWPDPDLGKEIEVDPDLDPGRGLKWIWIRNAGLYSVFHNHTQFNRINLLTGRVRNRGQPVVRFENFTCMFLFISTSP